MAYKQPRSVQVVIFNQTANGRDYLLLRRVPAYGGFWQSVTGSLEGCETHSDAAAREVTEETGIACHKSELIELGLVNTFEIAPQWRSRYAPDVTHNEEVCFALEVTERRIRIDQLEHDDYRWADFAVASKLVYWESTKRALSEVEKLGKSENG